MEENNIKILGARVHNLQNVDLEIPRGKLVVITGLSGSGKSSLAFDTIYAEGQRRYMETLSTYARQFVGTMERPDVDKITGLSPVVAIEQKTTNKNPRSTVGTVTEISDFLRLLYARASRAYSPVTGEEMVHYTDEQIVELILKEFDGRKIAVTAPIVKGRKGHYRELFESLIKKGYLYARIDGEIREISAGMRLDRYKIHTIDLVVDRLVDAFVNSKKLQQHVRFLFAKGSIYLVHDNNLLYHGCIAMNDDGEFRAFNVDGKSFAGKPFLDRVDRLARQGYFATDNPTVKQYGMDAMWFLWCAPQSPLFGKEKMATFERYFIADKATHAEKRNPYYDLRDDETTARKILAEFGVDPDEGRIINGHVPVKVAKGEKPIKAGGKMIVIDGGFSRAYQKQTGIAGYTLISNSRGLLLAAHQPFESTQKAVSEELDIDSEMEVIHSHPFRMRVRDTDRGREIQAQIDELQALLHAYREGLIKEHSVR